RLAGEIGDPERIAQILDHRASENVSALLDQARIRAEQQHRAADRIGPLEETLDRACFDFHGGFKIARQVALSWMAIRPDFFVRTVRGFSDASMISAASASSR